MPVYPFPPVNLIALSLGISVKRIERIPLVSYVLPWERAEIVPCPVSIVLPSVDGLMWETL